MHLSVIDFYSYHESVTAALDAVSAGETLAKQKSILLKPNLTNASPHPVTTPAACCEAVIEYIRSCSAAEVIIAEGCGDASLETDEIFDLLGYRNLAKRHKIILIDLNTAPLRKLKNNNCPIFPEIYLPEIAFTHFIISLPVLKAHSLSGITGTLKNMLGFAPPKYYAGRFGGWKKSVFHKNMQQSIIDLNLYRCPDLSVMDASVGLADFHLGGRHCTPPVKKIIAGYNPLEMDRQAANLLELDWQRIPHLSADFRFEPLQSSLQTAAKEKSSVLSFSDIKNGSLKNSHNLKHPSGIKQKTGTSEINGGKSWNGKSCL